LQLAFVAACTLSKDLQDQHGPIIDRHLDMALQIALLSRTQSLVEPDLFGPMHLSQHADLIRLTAAYKQSGIGSFALADQTRYRLQASSLNQKAQLFQLIVKMGNAKIHADQQHWRRRGTLKGFRTQIPVP